MMLPGVTNIFLIDMGYRLGVSSVSTYPAQESCLSRNELRQWSPWGLSWTRLVTTAKQYHCRDGYASANQEADSSYFSPDTPCRF